MSATPGLPSLVDLSLPKLPPLSSIFTKQGPSKAMAALKKGNLGIGFSGSGAFLGLCVLVLLCGGACDGGVGCARPTPLSRSDPETPTPAPKQIPQKKQK